MRETNKNGKERKVDGSALSKEPEKDPEKIQKQ
jgi:hypothetical protein